MLAIYDSLHAVGIFGRDYAKKPEAEFNNPAIATRMTT